MKGIKMKISGCVFDFGGVMTATTMPERVRQYAQKAGLDWGIFADGYERYRRLLDGDFLSFDEMYDLIFADAGIEIPPKVKAEIIESDMLSFTVRNEGTLAFMRSLKERGMKIGILTNMATAFVPRFRKCFHDFISLADAMVVSGEKKMFKPQKRIYELLQKLISLPGEELCFFDDVAANCEGARNASWHAIRFLSPDDASRKFDGLLESPASEA